MKKTIFVLIGILSLTAVSYAHAYTSPMHKLYAGVKQVVTGPFSIFTVPVQQMDRENDKALGFLGGLMEGATQSAVKPLLGIFNILTFPFTNTDPE